MTLYMLNKVNFPLTNAQISGFFLDKDYTSYFVLQQVISELIESKLISAETVRNTSYYKITDDGALSIDVDETERRRARILEKQKKLMGL